MDQEETIALFERCELARAEAKRRAQADGHSEEMMREISFEAARSVWNRWADDLLAERERLEDAGLWSADRQEHGPLEVHNEETQRWMQAAKADFSGLRFVMRIEADEIRLDLGDVVSRPSTWQPVKAVAYDQDDISFAGFIFPGLVDFEETQFTATVHFAAAQFMDEACFRDTRFVHDALFARAHFAQPAHFADAQFCGESRFSKAGFSASADFDRARFLEPAWFDELQVFGEARFGGAQFCGETRFENASFARQADFRGARFTSIAWFDKSQFIAEARFDEAQFESNAWFNDVQFSGEAHFHSARVLIADFQNARFADRTVFDKALFLGDADFRKAEFGGNTGFSRARFASETAFEDGLFTQSADFHGAVFSKAVTFRHTRFQGEVVFSEAVFGEVADFQLTAFPRFATFKGVRFSGLANFNAMRGAQAFDLTDAHFETAPDFIQAHFEEAPRLDNLVVRQQLVLGAQAFGPSRFWRSRVSYPLRAAFSLQHRLLSADPDSAARWRALKRLAARARDRDREREFFAREVRAARFSSDWPIPWPFWRPSAWLGFSRFWFGLLYGLFSNYGRSVILPVLWWIVVTAAFGGYYLAQQPDLAGERTVQYEAGRNWIPAWGVTRLTAAWSDPARCVSSGKAAERLARPPETVQHETSAPVEALYLSVRGGLVLFDMAPFSAPRSYACLYGTERLGDRVVPFIPASVSFAMTVQKVLAAAFLLLFLLGLRNMLKLG